MTYDQFLETVTNGKTEVSVSSQKKMPAFGTNPNVMCFIDDIYAYLKARADGALERGRPQHVDKPEEPRRGTMLASVLRSSAVAIFIAGLPFGPTAWGQTIEAVDRTALRICADPHNLPSRTTRGGVREQDRRAAGF